MAVRLEPASVPRSDANQEEALAIRVAVAVFRLLSSVYPVQVRAHWKAEVAQVFADTCSAAYARARLRGVVATTMRALPAVLWTAFEEHLDTWTAPHPASSSCRSRLALICAAIGVVNVIVFGIDHLTPPEFQVAIIYGVLIFAAGALLPPRLAATMGLVTLAAYVVDDWVADEWTVLRMVGLVAMLMAATGALHLGAVHARLRGSAPRRLT